MLVVPLTEEFMNSILYIFVRVSESTFLYISQESSVKFIVLQFFCLFVAGKHVVGNICRNHKPGRVPFVKAVR
jgi:hypothetical protein